MKLLVTGDRCWDDLEQVVAVMCLLPPGSIVINGGCRGADEMCAVVAEALGLVVRTYRAQWHVYGRGAGPVRNQQMLDEEHVVGDPIDMCVAFHNNISQSRGTKDMLARVERAGIRNFLISSVVDVRRSIYNAISCSPSTTVPESVDGPGSNPGVHCEREGSTPSGGTQQHVSSDRQ